MWKVGTQYTIWHDTLDNVWGALSFIALKETRDMSVLTDFGELHK